MNKPTNPNIVIPESFAANGVKADFDSNKILNGFDRIQPDVLAGDNLNKFIDDTYKGLNYGIKGVDYLEERWKSQLTNCILEIPQRIKYTLKDGTLTIKAGSVVIVPYGVEDLTTQYPVGSVFIHENFKVVDTQYQDGKFFVWVELVNDVISNTSGSSTEEIQYMCMDLTLNTTSWQKNTESGTNTTSSQTYTLYYNTDTNLIGITTNTTTPNYNEVFSFVYLSAINSTSNSWKNINQVFNGMGYIGSTVWVDKGVKFLMANGRNEDGTLKNIEYTTEERVYTETTSRSENAVITIAIDNNGRINAYTDYFSQEENPNTPYTCWYKPSENNFYTSDGESNFSLARIVPILFYKSSNLQITKVTPYNTVDLLKRSNKSEISGWGMPSNKYINLTFGASGTSYTAPANGWFTIYARAKASTTTYLRFRTSNISIESEMSSVGNANTLLIPLLKGDKLYVDYTNINTPDIFRFIYAEGEV